nr:hypothetical protein [uncultured Sphingomonas sp.]
MRVRTTLMFLAATALVANPVVAKDQPAAPSPLVRALDACRAIADDAQRLACFDKSSTALVEAANSGAVSVVDRGQLRQARRSLFGFSMPKLPFFAGDKSAEDDTGILESQITATKGLPYDRYRITIKDGDAVWETTETRTNLWPPKAGQKIIIQRGPLGSYFLKFDGQLGVKGKRVQ